jgi:hypothetical protein
MSRTVADLEVPPAHDEPSPAGVGPLVALGLAGALIVATAIAGRLLQDVFDVRLFTTFPPLTADLDPRVTGRLLPALAVASALVAWGPRLAMRLGWRTMLAGATLAAAAWGAALALGDGAAGFVAAPGRSEDYLASLDATADLGAFLRGFTDLVPSLSVHARSHPPGMLVILRTMDTLGLGGAAWFAAMQIVLAASASAAALVATRAVADERRARAVAPFLVLLPAAVSWSSGDAVFMGVGAWAVACTVLATVRRATWLAIAGGVLFAATLFSSYGLVLLFAVPAVLAWRRRSFSGVAVSAIVAAVTVLMAGIVTGFWWWEGLGAARREYLSFVTSSRPYVYALFANLGALAIALGPAVVGAFGRPRDRDVWPLVGGAVLAVALADLSGMSALEVERIWLPFIPWIAIAAVAYAGDANGTIRGWLAAQAGTGLLLQSMLRSPW